MHVTFPAFSPMENKTSVNLLDQPKPIYNLFNFSYRGLRLMKRVQPGSLRFHVSSNMDHMVISLAPALNVEPHNLIRDSLSMVQG